MSHAGLTGQTPCPPGDSGPRGGCPLTSKSWYCSSVSALLATTSVRRPSRAMFPHWESTGRSQACHWLGTPPGSHCHGLPQEWVVERYRRRSCPPAPPVRSPDEVLTGQASRHRPFHHMRARVGGFIFQTWETSL